MKKRNGKKKAASAVKSKDTASARAAASGKPTRGKQEAVEATKANVVKLMPKVKPEDGSPAPVVYGGGVIYTSFAKRAFRALKVRGDNYTEKRAAWGGPKPSVAAWKTVIKAIEDHHKGKKKT